MTSSWYLFQFFASLLCDYSAPWLASMRWTLNCKSSESERGQDGKNKSLGKTTRKVVLCETVDVDLLTRLFLQNNFEFSGTARVYL